MGEIADAIINGDFDEVTGEYLGQGYGYPRTKYTPRKSDDLSWKRVTGIMNTYGIKSNLHPQTLKDYGCKYSGKHPLRNACFEALSNLDKFKEYIISLK